MAFRQMSRWDMIHDLLADGYAAWSREGAEALADYYDDQDLEWDRVAVRCTWSEYGSAAEAAGDLLGQWHYVEGSDDDAIETAALQALRERADVLTFNGGVLVSEF